MYKPGSIEPSCIWCMFVQQFIPPEPEAKKTEKNILNLKLWPSRDMDLMHNYTASLGAGGSPSCSQGVKSAGDATWRIIAGDPPFFGEGTFLAVSKTNSFYRTAFPTLVPNFSLLGPVVTSNDALIW
jgi:hypothetical protein